MSVSSEEYKQAQVSKNHKISRVLTMVCDGEKFTATGIYPTMEAADKAIKERENGNI